MSQNLISLTVSEQRQATALEGYGQIKLSSAAQGLEDLRKEIGGRWARGPRKQAQVAAA